MTHRFNLPVSYLITPGEATPIDFHTRKSEILTIVKQSADEGVSLIQIREKQLPARLLFELAADASAITRDTDTKLLVNDRADIALASRADGAHLPANSVPAGMLRRTFPDGFLIGTSVHSLEELLEAKSSGADFVTYGPVFHTPGKGEAKGLQELERVCSAAGDFPVIALGGVSVENYASVLKAGAAGLAAIRALNDGESRRRMLAGLKAYSP